MRVRVLVAVEELALRARLAVLLRSCGYVAVLGSSNRRELLDSRDLGAAIVVPPSFDDTGLTLARRLCADGCRVIVLADSREAVGMVSRNLPDAHTLLAQQADEQ